MAERRTSRQVSTVRKSTRKQPQEAVRYQFSAIIGGALIALALLWFVWLLIRQMNPLMNSITLPMPGSFVQNPPASSGDPLAAAGITLTSPTQGQEPALTKQQALLLAGQIESAVATRAGGTDVQYTLFSYSSPDTSQTSFHNVPVWLIHYSKVSEPHPDTSADPHASTVQHDFYVFLDATSGQELLAIWL
jgi:hypothetical protein